MRNKKDYAKISLLKNFIENKINGNCDIENYYDERKENFVIKIEFWCKNQKDCYWEWEERDTENNEIKEVFEDLFNQIYESYQNYDVDEETEINLQWDKSKRPPISYILEDCKEEEETLYDLTLGYQNVINNIDSAIEKILV